MVDPYIQVLRTHFVVTDLNTLATREADRD